MQTKRNVLLSFFLWICLWEGYSIWKGERVFFPSLEMVVTDGILLLQTAFFWKTLGLTILRVAVGFGLCCSLSVVLALLTFLETRDGNFVDCFFWSMSYFTKCRFNCFVAGFCSAYLAALCYSSLCGSAFDV
ncbi:hypothetical protein HMPREF9466_02583 [Fusobacterium necrophorum subsp. funduliforme 1_1_36S]|nr:hypothetical protein HMPREF9466_02583 [Fusobacterium necrophorum subsp. funduliforme 1_1_36S]